MRSSGPVFARLPVCAQAPWGLPSATETCASCREGQAAMGVGWMISNLGPFADALPRISLFVPPFSESRPRLDEGGQRHNNGRGASGTPGIARRPFNGEHFITIDTEKRIRQLHDVLRRLRFMSHSQLFCDRFPENRTSRPLSGGLACLLEETRRESIRDTIAFRPTLADGLACSDDPLC